MTTHYRRSGCMLVAVLVGAFVLVTGGEAHARPCGSPGTPCCKLPRVACSSRAICQRGRCVRCGYSGRVCCHRNRCHTRLTCHRGRCKPCGSRGQMCCRGRKCVTGYLCDRRTRKCRPKIVQTQGIKGGPGARCTKRFNCLSGLVCANRRCCRKPGSAVRSKFYNGWKLTVIAVRPLRCDPGWSIRRDCKSLVRNVLRILETQRLAFDQAHSAACTSRAKSKLGYFKAMSIVALRGLKQLRACQQSKSCFRVHNGVGEVQQPIGMMGTGAIGFTTNEATVAPGSACYDLGVGQFGTGLPF